jgi:hypothetical protein
MANSTSYLTITHTTLFDIWFGRYGILKSCFGSGQATDQLNAGVRSGLKATKWVKLARVRIQLLTGIKLSFRCLLKHTFLVTIATVTTV